MGRKRRLCVANHLLRVRLTERAPGLSERASAAPSSLSKRASETGDECASGRSSLHVATTIDQATRTEFERSSIRLRSWAAMATSVARASSLWKRSPSPMTCFQRANWPSTPAL